MWGEVRNLIWENYIKESPIIDSLLDCSLLNVRNQRSNAFIISNSRTELLKHIQDKIKYNYQLIWKNEDEVINNLVQKLISNVYVLYKTGPGIFPSMWLETNYFLSDVCSLESLNAVSTWLNMDSEDSFSFEDLKTKYSLQCLLSESKPNIKGLFSLYVLFLNFIT